MFLGRADVFVFVLPIYPITQPIILQLKLSCCQLFIPPLLICIQRKLFSNSGELIELAQHMFLSTCVHQICCSG